MKIKDLNIYITSKNRANNCKTANELLNYGHNTFKIVVEPQDYDSYIEHYNKENVIQKYWDGEKITNHFGRKIKADEFHALNYLIQSTTADIVFRKLIEIVNLLENKESSVSFTIHDAIILDIVDKERYIIPMIKDIMELFLAMMKDIFGGLVK